MGEEKRNRIVAAVTVNAIILVFIIVAVIIYQIVTISVLSARKKQLYAELYELQQQYEEAGDILDRLENDEEYRRIVTALGQLGEDVSNLLPEKGAN